MKVVGTFWKIECSQHTKVIFSTKISIKEITEKKLIEFIQVIIAKYALSDSEILEQHIRKPFKPKKEYISIQRFENVIDGVVHLGFYCQSSDISLDAYLSQ